MLTLFQPTQTFKLPHWPEAIVRSSNRWSRPIARSLRKFWMGLFEGVTAHHRYEEMMRHGVPSDRALRLALGISHAGKCVSSQPSEREGEHGHI